MGLSIFESIPTADKRKTLTRLTLLFHPNIVVLHIYGSEATLINIPGSYKVFNPSHLYEY